MTAELLKKYLPLAAGACMLYMPYIWCIVRHESYSEYNLNYNYNKKVIKETLIISAVILLLITPAAFYLNHALPYSRGIKEILSLAGTGLAAAVIEETFFRGWIQNILKKKLPVTASVVIASALFASSHLILLDDKRLLLTFFPGLVMGYLAERYKSIFPAIIFHFLGNCWSVFLFPF